MGTGVGCVVLHGGAVSQAPKDDPVKRPQYLHVGDAEPRTLDVRRAGRGRD